MQFKAASVLALATSVSATAYGSNITYVTEVVTALTTVCPAATELTFNGQTYTVTESETLTITNCPCTVSKPVYTTSSVVCNTCTTLPTVTPKPYTNTTTPSVVPSLPVGTGSPIVPSQAPPAGASPSASQTPPTVPASSANKVFAMSGASLAGLLALAAYLL